jgi:hypothetical protein
MVLVSPWRTTKVPPPPASCVRVSKSCFIADSGWTELGLVAPTAETVDRRQGPKPYTAVPSTTALGPQCLQACCAKWLLLDARPSIVLPHLGGYLRMVWGCGGGVYVGLH